MLKNALWRRVAKMAGISHENVLCTDCIETTLGRPLVDGDMYRERNGNTLVINDAWLIRRTQGRKQAAKFMKEKGLKYVQT